MKTRISVIAIGFGLACVNLSVLAQSATITANGIGNDGYIEQVSPSSTTTASITQNGNYNKVGSAGIGGGVGTALGIRQGSGNKQAAVAQNGDKNAATVDQVGARNDNASITQTSASGAAEGNAADVFQSLIRPSSTNNATIVQNGVNAAHVEQFGGKTSIHQDGGLSAKNTATVRQASYGGAQASIDQSGDNLQANISQGLTTEEANITQSGANHTATVRQGSDLSFSYRVSINQSGGFAIGNTANVEQLILSGSSAAVNQSGDFLRTDVLQEGGLFTNVTVNQSGLDQTANLKQLGYGKNNQELVVQGGQANDAFLTQNNVTYSSIELTQFGTGTQRNIMTISQNGVGHDSSNDIVIAKQNGAGNVGTIVQSGSWNLAEIDQNGNGNTAAISQNGTGSSLSTQNSAWIAQTGNLYNASITQNGMGNHSGIVQR